MYLERPDPHETNPSTPDEIQGANSVIWAWPTVMVTLAACRRVTFSSLSRIAPACGFIPRRWERWLLRKQRARVGQREQEQPPFLSTCQGLWTRMAYMTIGIFSNLRVHASEISFTFDFISFIILFPLSHFRVSFCVHNTTNSCYLLSHLPWARAY